jgi:chromatin remodeling complex protein RSC6
MKLQSATEVGPHRVVAATEEFASIVGQEDQPRSRAVAKFWAYVQGNKLINPDRPNIILADHNLLDAFRMFRGRRELEMKDIPDFFSIHLIDQY